MNEIELCRLCAQEKGNLLYIYGDEGHKLCIEAKIKKCLNIQLREKANLPKSICLECCTKLDAFEEFLDLSQSAQATLCLLFPDSKPSGILNHVFAERADEEDFNDEFMPDEDVYSSTIEEDSLLLEGKHGYLTGYHEVNKSPPPNATSNVSQTSNDEARDKTDTSDASEPDSDVKALKSFEISLWLCSDCSEEFSNVEDLKTHHSTEHKQDPRYLCAYCAKVFYVYNSFVGHVNRHFNGLKYKCELCTREFASEKSLATHKTMHSNLRPFVCQECGKGFRQQSALYIHSRCHLPDDVKNKYPCDQCNKRFSTKPNLVTHMRIHTGIRNFTCDQCGKSFIQKGNLDAHLLTHSHDKPYKCELCNKSFKTSMQLRKHHSVHTGSKPHKCDVCGRTFREKGTLREHHRIHTGAMPFTCEYCGKAFRFKGILTTHRRQHTGERPYSCNECQHHFTNWPNYNKHMKRRHGINLSRANRTNRVPEEKTPVDSQAVQSEEPQSDPLLQDFPPTELYANMSAQNLLSNPPAGFVPYQVFQVDQVPEVDSSEPGEMPR